MSRGRGSFVMITREELKSPTFKQLSKSAKLVFIVAKYEAGYQIRARREKRMYGDYNGMYKSDFKLPYVTINQYLDMSDPTIATALKELVRSGFLIQTFNGGLKGAGGVASRYQLSLAWQESSPIIKQKRTIRLKKDSESVESIPLSRYSGTNKKPLVEGVENPFLVLGGGKSIYCVKNFKSFSLEDILAGWGA